MQYTSSICCQTVHYPVMYCKCASFLQYKSSIIAALWQHILPCQYMLQFRKGYFEQIRHSLAFIDSCSSLKIDWLYVGYHLTCEFFIHKVTTPLPLKGSNIFNIQPIYMLSSWPLSMDECVMCHTCRISNQFRSFHFVAIFRKVAQKTRGYNIS